MIRVDCEDCGYTIQTRHEKHTSFANIDVFLFSCGIKTNTELTNKAKNRKTNQMKLNSNTDQEQIQLILERMNLYNESFV